MANEKDLTKIEKEKPLICSENIKIEIDSFNDDYERLKEELMRLRDENDALKNKNRSLEDTNKSLEKEYKNLEEKKEIIEDELKKVKDLNNRLEKILRTMGIEFEKIKNENKELKHRTSLNSTNSSKPPSSDGYRKPSPKSLRVKSGKKPGGQIGHIGHNMIITRAPDEIISHFPPKCIACSNLEKCASGTGFVCSEKRCVVDIITATKITEHRVMKINKCPKSTDIVGCTGAFPAEVKAHAQYGDSVTVFSTLLNTYGAVSYSRISRLMRDIFGISISAGTINNMVVKSARKLSKTLGKIKKGLIKSKVCHFDETGARTNGGIYWVHSSSSSEYTYQTASPKRGHDGIQTNGVLPKFKGVAVHDCWSPYWKYGIDHAICNVHILRELRAIEEMEEEHVWPRLFRIFLNSMRITKKDLESSGSNKMSDEMLKEYRERFDRIMRLADNESPLPVERKTRRRYRAKRTKERALIDRILCHKESIFNFIRDFDIPFDNNQAERDVRNVKTKVKVSGCFRSGKGIQNYLDIMSYISTGKKHGINAFEALVAAFNGRSDIVL